MKILVAGATGAIGRHLVPLLAAAGHDVVGTTRRAQAEDAIRRMGGIPARLDALDTESVAQLVVRVEPEVIVHQLTDLATPPSGRSLDAAMAGTNRLRVEATNHLLAAARAAGVRRVVAQSYAGSGMPYAPADARIGTEDDAPDTDPPRTMRRTLEALRHLEDAVTSARPVEGIVLRYGSFYGPGTAFSETGPYFELIRRRRMPVIGGGAGVWSFVHVHDAAEATTAAVERGSPGIYNIVDDEPAAVAEWLPAAAALLGAKPPLRMPRWMALLLAGPAVTRMMTQGRGSSNTRAKRELDWTPRHRSWRDGFAEAAAS